MNQKTGPTKKKDFEYPRGPDVNDNKMRMRKSRLSNKEIYRDAAPKSTGTVVPVAILCLFEKGIS